jgi:hypothetical protein
MAIVAAYTGRLGSGAAYAPGSAQPAMGVSGLDVVVVGGGGGAVEVVVAGGVVVVVTGAAEREPDEHDEHAASTTTAATATNLTAPCSQHYGRRGARPHPDVPVAHQPAARRRARRALR